MQNIEIKEIISEERGIQIGYARTVVDGKIELLIKILKSKSGGVFCVMPTIYLNGQFDDAFSFLDKDKEKSFLMKVKEEINNFKAKDVGPFA